MKILAIETSCDETSIAIIEKVDTQDKGVYRVLAHNTISQINVHAQYGGVYPMLARREHEKNLIPLLHKSLLESNLLMDKKNISEEKIFTGEIVEWLERYQILSENLSDFYNKFDIQKIDALAITNGPGLPPALWVGVNFAKVISALYDINNIYPINHMEGHIIGGITTQSDLNDKNILEVNKLEYPAMSFLISGGHTELVLSQKNNHYEKIGETLDDAVGESYDKVARMLGLEYPGGPKVAILADHFRKKNEGKKYNTKFPRPLLHSNDLNFSFSGLKTHILYFLRDFRLDNKLNEKDILPQDLINEICFEFEETVKEVFMKKLETAIYKNNIQTLIVGGGVASNDYLRENFINLSEKLNIKVYVSDKSLSTDNALMIALTASMHIGNDMSPTDINNFKALGSLSL